MKLHECNQVLCSDLNMIATTVRQDYLIYIHSSALAAFNCCHGLSVIQFNYPTKLLGMGQ